MVSVSACGGRLLGVGGANGGDGDAVGESRTDGGAEPTTGADGATAGSPQSILDASLSSSSTQAGGRSGAADDASCSASVVTFEATNEPFAVCWACARSMCGLELAACAADCGCNSILDQALGCADDGHSSLGGCVGPLMQLAGDRTELPVAMCLGEAYGACVCPGQDGGDDVPPPPDGWMGGGGFGSLGADAGECTSAVRTIYDGGSYQVSCSCPEGACVCFGPTATRVVSYPGCPFCPSYSNPLNDAATIEGVASLCGFPPYGDD